MPDFNKYQRMTLIVAAVIIVVVQIFKFSEYGVEGHWWIISFLVAGALIFIALSNISPVQVGGKRKLDIHKDEVKIPKQALEGVEMIQLNYNEEFGVYSGYYMKGTNFTKFRVDQDDSVTETPVVGDFRDYGHFVGVFSKFNPYTFFWKNPVIIKTLNVKELEKHKSKIIKLKKT